MRSHRAAQPSLLFFSLILSFVLLALLLFPWFRGISDSRPDVRCDRDQVVEYFHRVWLTLDYYENAARRASRKNCLPITTRNRSWRIDAVNTYIATVDKANLEERWTTDTYRKYDAPGASAAFCFLKRGKRLSWRKRFTRIMALTGSGTAMTECSKLSGPSLKEIDPDTIILVEVSQERIHWMQPGDLEISSMSTELKSVGDFGISGNYPGGFHVLFADGAVWFLNEDIPFDCVSKFFTISGAEAHDREIDLVEYAIANHRLDASPFVKRFREIGSTAN